MALRQTNLVFNEYYHLYNRGNGKMVLFKDEKDYEHFKKLLYICNSEFSFTFEHSIVEQKINAWDFDRGKPLVSIVAWTLMPNHFHLYLISHRSDLWEKDYNPITEYMRKVSTAYAMYFNKKYERTGSLFEGKFKSKHVGVENYFRYLFAYIHLNCVKLIQSDWKENGIKNVKTALKYLEEYKHSSFQDYFGLTRKESKIIDKKAIPEDIKKPHAEELFNWIRLGDFS